MTSNNAEIYNINNLKFSFIGCGNMAKAIIVGIINSGVKPSQIIASTNTVISGEKIKSELGIEVAQDNNKCLEADIIIFAVKPQVLEMVLNNLDISGLDISKKLFLSVIAGVSSSYYMDILGEIKLIRAMPNTPSTILEAITGLFATDNCKEIDKKSTELIFTSIGKVLWVNKEKDINIVNAISGSGPAYFYLFIKYLASSGEKLGLSYQDSLSLAIQTAKGAASLAEKETDGTEQSLQVLIDKVTSKGGTTYEAINSFKNDNLEEIVDNAVIACYKRAVELGKDK